MDKKLNILAFAGSLRKGSFNKGLIRAVIAGAPETMQITPIEFDGLPFYNQDLEDQFPAEVAQLKEKIRAADGIIIATPEYNRSIPGVLKNMFDWTSRPYGDNAWAGKPVATMGAGGAIATALGQYHLKQILLYLDARVLGQPEFFISASGKFDPNGNVADEKVKEYIGRLLTAFEKFINS